LNNIDLEQLVNSLTKKNVIKGAYFREVIRLARHYSKTGEGYFSDLARDLINEQLRNNYSFEETRLKVQHTIISFEDTPSEHQKAEADAKIKRKLGEYKNNVKNTLLTKHALRKINFNCYVSVLVCIAHKGIAICEPIGRNIVADSVYFDDDCIATSGYTCYHKVTKLGDLKGARNALLLIGENVSMVSDNGWQNGKFKLSDLDNYRYLNQWKECDSCGIETRIDMFTGYNTCRSCRNAEHLKELGYIAERGQELTGESLIKARCATCDNPIKPELTYNKRKQKRFICKHEPKIETPKPVNNKGIKKGVKKIQVAEPSESKRIVTVINSSSIAGNGFIYAVRHPWIDNKVKIGATTKTVQERANSLQSGAGLPVPFVIVASLAANNAKQAENDAHCYFEEYHLGGEWFDLTDLQIKKYFSLVQMNETVK